MWGDSEMGGRGQRGGAVRRNWNHPGDFDVIARIQTVSWSKFKCFGGLDKHVKNNTTESAGHFTQLKYTCPSESN